MDSSLQSEGLVAPSRCLSRQVTRRRSAASLAIAAMLIVALVAPATLAQTPSTPSPAAAALEKAVAAEPADAVLTYFLAVVRAQSGDPGGALAALEQTLQRGNGFLPPDDIFESLGASPQFQDLQAQYARKLPRVVTGNVVATMSDPLLIPEGLAYDGAERVLYVGSIARRGIYRIGGRGKLEPLSAPTDELDAVLGLAIDERGRKLYAVSTSALTSAGRSRPRNAVVVYDLRTGRRERAYLIPGATQLNDVAIGDGFILATDSAAGGVWRVALADGNVDAVVPMGRAPGANGIALAGNGHAYVAANRRPLRLDLGTGEVTPLRLPPREQAAAIDGLYWHDGYLVGIQNVTTRGRVVRLALAADGTTVSRVETLQSHHQPAFFQPTTAAPAADGLYVLTRTYVTRFDADGKIAGVDTVRPAQVLRIPWPASGS